MRRVPVHISVSSGIEKRAWATVSPIIRAGGRIIGCLMMLREFNTTIGTDSEVEYQLTIFNSILKHFPTPFFIVDPDLRITYMNERLEELSGYRREEAVGKLTCAEVLRTEQCHTAQCPLRQSMENKQPISGVRRVIKNRIDQEIPVVVSASIITDDQGDVIGGFEAFRDISAIVEAEKKIELLIEMSQEGILIVDRDYRINFANYRMATICRCPKEELIDMDVRRILPEDHIRMMTEMFQRSDRSHPQQQMCFWNTVPFDTAGGEDQRTFEAWMAVSRINNNDICFLYFRDLTERIRAERQLHKANSFLENIIQSIVEGIVVLDNKGNVVIFNEGAERILGCKAEDVIGHPEVFHKLYPLEQAREMMKLIRSDLYGPPGKLDTIETTLTNIHGEKVPLNFSAAIIKEGDEEIGTVGIFSDLRERKKMERELEEARLQLIQAEKIASLGRLAAGVAHEINNPLAGILLYADMLMKAIGHDEQCCEDLQEIINQTLRCKEIVTRLLQFSRQSLGEKTLLAVDEIIKQSIELLARQSLFHDIEIVEELEAGIQLRGDPGQLRQVFTNLMINAADAMKGKGRLTVRCRCDDSAQQVVIKFIDTGPGIDTEMRNKIFEPFFTTKPTGKGTGLGLSIVYGVVKRHGGTIEVDSKPGKGTVFTIRLPFNGADEQSEKTESVMFIQEDTLPAPICGQ